MYRIRSYKVHKKPFVMRIMVPLPYFLRNDRGVSYLMKLHEEKLKMWFVNHQKKIVFTVMEDILNISFLIFCK